MNQIINAILEARARRTNHTAETVLRDVFAVAAAYNDRWTYPTIRVISQLRAAIIQAYKHEYQLTIIDFDDFDRIGYDRLIEVSSTKDPSDRARVWGRVE